MIECLVVGIGGFIGAICRYLMGLIPIKVTFLNTMIINIIGAMVIGLVVALGSKYSLDNRVILFLKTGICGGFTTFSNVSKEKFEKVVKPPHIPVFKNNITLLSNEYLLPKATTNPITIAPIILIIIVLQKKSL